MNSLIRKPKLYSAWAFFILFPFITGSIGIYNSFLFTLQHLTLFILAEIIIRIAQATEYNFSLKRGESISREILIKISSFNFASQLTILGVTILILSFGVSEIFIDVQYWLPMICAHFFIRMVGFNESVYLKSIWIENSNGLDYGSGMAHSFFYGYLHIILPNKGDKNFALKELMEIYESAENIKFAVKKLFILIPRSLYCPPNLCEVAKGSHVSMEAAKSLESIERDRAGVKSRIYKNSIYKIHVQGQNSPVYVAAEGATPLLTLFETLKNNGIYQEYYHQHKDEIVLQFYWALKNLIKTDIECKDLCEVIYYDNLNSDVNVGEILLKKISEIQQNSGHRT